MVCVYMCVYTETGGEIIQCNIYSKYVFKSQCWDTVRLDLQL